MNRKAAQKSFQKVHTRVFFGFDLAGSTAFKQRSGDEDSVPDGAADYLMSWARQTHHFYAATNREVAAGILSARRQAPRRFARHFKTDLHDLWKGAGDELIFERILERLTDVPVVVLAFYLAYRALREAVRERSGGQLDVKAAAWSAGFPLANMFLPINDQMADAGIDAMFAQDEKTYRREMILRAADGVLKGTDRWDFVGPGMDTGFRVASMAAAGEVVMSMDLTYLLACAMATHGAGKDGGAEAAQAFATIAPTIRPGKPLKGVWGNLAYPRIAIDAGQPLEALRSDIDPAAFLEHWQNTHDACLHFYEDLATRGLPASISRPPYLMGNRRVEAGMIPKQHAEFVEQYQGKLPPATRERVWDDDRGAPAKGSSKVWKPMASGADAAEAARRRWVDEVLVRKQVRWMSDDTMSYMEEKIIGKRDLGRRVAGEDGLGSGGSKWSGAVGRFVKEQRAKASNPTGPGD